MGQQLNKQRDDVASSKSHIDSRSRYNSQADLDLEVDLAQELPATINLQIAEAGETAAGVDTIVSEEEALAETSAEVRQIIIKIQLAKMENGNDSSEQEQQQQQQQMLRLPSAGECATMSVDALNANEKIVNVKVGAAGGIAGTGASGTAGSSTEAPKTNERQLVNNNNLAGSIALASQPASTSTSASAAVKTLKLHDEGDANEDIESEMATSSLLRRRRSNSNSSNEGVDYCEVLEPQPVNEMLSNGAQRAQAPSSSGNSCSRCQSNKASSAVSASTTTTTAVTSKRRCCKCKFLDAYRGMRSKLESSISSSSAKDKKETAAAAAATTTTTKAAETRSKTRSSADRRSTPPTLNGSSSSSSAAAMRLLHTQRQRNSVAVAEPSTLGIWAEPAMGQGHWYRSYAQGDVIIRISSQPQSQFVMDSAVGGAAAAGCICSSSNNNNNGNINGTPLVTVGHNIRIVAATADPAGSAAVLPLATIEPRPAANAYGAGVTVHSQIDFMHCLVPDLERIINSSFYWGKMDRYEAERLLEGKPEGTFLLRDSAQEEFLFSVTFRKYGRSLHARIEQSGHKFSFDCHDPCVFAALTVTGLLEHYKDPSCVMFFEPCLTMPLHRRQTFSLQQLSRATIVSNTTYDGINQLELPGRLKSYLKEYHYKQKLRVKPCDAHTPAPFYSNI